MPQPTEYDTLKQTVLRDHLADLEKIQPAEAPSGQFTIDRGYLDVKGNSTLLGDEYLSLLDSGLMDDKGEVTPDGKIYAMSQKDSVYGSFDNYYKREKLGLNDIDKNAVDKPSALSSIGGIFKDFFTESLPKIGSSLIQDGNDPIKQIMDTASFVKGSLMSLEPLGTGAYYKIADLMLPLQDGSDNEKDIAALILKQEYERKRFDYDNINGADLLTAISGGSNIPQKLRDSMVRKYGEDQVVKDEKSLELGGALIADPTMIASLGTTTIAKGLTTTATRAILNAEKMALKSTVLATKQVGIQVEIKTLESALSKMEATGTSVTERASALRSIGNEAHALKYESVASKISGKMDLLKSRLNELTTKEGTLANDIAGISKKAGVADAILALNNKAMQFKRLPAQITGQALESIGSAVMKADSWLDDIATRTGVDGVYNSLKSIPGASASLLSTTFLGPAATIPAVAARVLASGPFVESVGRFTKILGRELMQERGSVPYWRRVANNPTISTTQRFLSHRMDELTLGGRATQLAGSVGKGTVYSYPMNLGITYLQDPYADPKDIINTAAAQSFVFGGGSMGAGQMFRGSKSRLKETRINDEINFTRNLLESQKAGYHALSKGAKRSVATYGEAFPNLNFEFVDGLPSKYDAATNTVSINTRSNNPLRPLIAHEVMHYATIRNQITPVIHNMLLGDTETPGILRKTDGTLDPSFQKFKQAYDIRSDAAQIERRPIEAVVEEYFIENTVDHLVSMVESGEVSRMAGRTQAGRQMQKFIEQTMPKAPILKDLFFRTGGAMDSKGGYVQGNGLLADGIRELPEAKSMMRNLMRELSGEAVVAKQTKGFKDTEKQNLPVQKGDAIVDAFHSIFETDANGKPITDKDGNHIALSKAIDEARQSAGLIITEAQTKRVTDGYTPKNGEIKRTDNGWQGKYIAPELINALAAKGILNPKQIAILRNINTATRTGAGTRYMVINHPATIKGRGGKVRYASLEATLRETVPVGMSVTKNGNILVHLMSVDQLHKNVTARAASKRGQELYNGNTEVIKQDIAAMMDLHATNTKTDKYYQDKYGAKWQEHQQFINTIFGQMTKEQRNINPMFEADKIKDGNVYRTYRLDRISKATKMDGTPMPFGYDYVKVNYFPDGFTEKINTESIKMNTDKEIQLMDERLNSPRPIPSDLQKAWEIGNKASNLSDVDAVYSGLVPDWVFNFGKDVAEFYEAGKRNEKPEYVVGWRRGEIPERGASTNWAENKPEPGVSLAYAHNRTDMELNPMTMIGVANRDKVFIDGWAFPKSRWGSDGEIVLVGSKQLKSEKSKE